MIHLFTSACNEDDSCAIEQFDDPQLKQDLFEKKITQPKFHNNRNQLTLSWKEILENSQLTQPTEYVALLYWNQYTS